MPTAVEYAAFSAQSNVFSEKTSHLRTLVPQAERNKETQSFETLTQNLQDKSASGRDVEVALSSVVRQADFREIEEFRNLTPLVDGAFALDDLDSVEALYFSSIQENLASRQEKVYSEIADPDFAKETADLIKAQLLINGSAEVVASANLAPSLVLSLLS